MKKHNLLILLVLSLAKLHGQVITSYHPRLVSSKGILDITETYAPVNASGYVRTVNVYSADTAAMRKYIVAERAFQIAEAARLQTLADEADAKADSLYLALVDMNDGLGAVDGPEPLREPSRPDDTPGFRWGAILRNDENEIG